MLGIQSKCTAAHSMVTQLAKSIPIESLSPQETPLQIDYSRKEVISESFYIIIFPHQVTIGGDSFVVFASKPNSKYLAVPFCSVVSKLFPLLDIPKMKVEFKAANMPVLLNKK